MAACAERIGTEQDVAEACSETRAGFSAYLDGALDGRTMTALAAHLRECEACAVEFAAWRSMQNALGDLGPARFPMELQAQLRDTLAGEIGTRRHLSPLRRVTTFAERTLAPMGARVAAGLAATLVILGSASWFVGTALPVQANDDRIAHLAPPRFLYSSQPMSPITARGTFVAAFVDAKIDADGRVYDFDLIDGPTDAQTRLNIEKNLLSSVFKPATVFGEPVPGHVIVTYTTVSARL